MKDTENMTNTNLTNEHLEGQPTKQPPSGASRHPWPITPALGVALVAVTTWQFAGVTNDGLQVQVLDPTLHLIWKAILVVTIGTSAVCGLAAWGRRRWTRPLAAVNAVANGLAATVVIALTTKGILFASSLPTRLGSADWSDLTELFTLLVAGIAVWDSIYGILRADRHAPDAAARLDSASPGSRR